MIIPLRICRILAFAVSLTVVITVIFYAKLLNRQTSWLNSKDPFKLFYSESSKVTFKDAVTKYSDSRRQIFLSTVDSSYVEMAFNLYLTSYSSLKISNYLFIGTDSNACKSLNSHASVHCLNYEFNEQEGNVSSIYGSAGFIRKSHYKPQVIVEALRLGFTVIIVDVDIVFFKNPLKYLTCESCDIQIQNDTAQVNSGFYMARPTSASITLHENALELGRNNTKLCDQDTFDLAIKSMVKQKTIEIKMLSLEQFPGATMYFEEKNIMFIGDGYCSECVLVHNNYIFTQEAKIYRFKESGMWEVDSDGYYSDPSRKYLTYDNTVDFGADRTKDLETEVLKIALYLGQLLNRTLILPTFHCYGCNYGACRNFRKRCALNTFFHIATFDVHFKGAYREHVFLHRSKVPDSVKRDLSPTVLIKSKMSVAELAVVNHPSVTTFVPKDLATGAIDSELIKWFHGGTYGKYSVLRFHSLYGAATLSGNPAFVNKISASLKSVNYRQF